MALSAYTCYYCLQAANYAYEIIGHTIASHPDRFLVIKERIIQDNKQGFRSKHYHFVPDVLKSDGQHRSGPGSDEIKIVKES